MPEPLRIKVTSTPPWWELATPSPADAPRDLLWSWWCPQCQDGQIWPCTPGQAADMGRAHLEDKHDIRLEAVFRRQDGGFVEAIGLAVAS